MNNFEKWKQDFTLDKYKAIVEYVGYMPDEFCWACPVSLNCETSFNANKGDDLCKKLLRTWGEFDESNSKPFKIRMPDGTIVERKEDTDNG